MCTGIAHQGSIVLIKIMDNIPQRIDGGLKMSELETAIENSATNTESSNKQNRAYSLKPLSVLRLTIV